MVNCVRKEKKKKRKANIPPVVFLSLFFSCTSWSLMIILRKEKKRAKPVPPVNFSSFFSIFA